MVLDELHDGAKRHVYGSGLVQDEGVQRLVFILCLPLIDGVFATLLVTGAVETFSAVVAVALTIFAGAGSLAVLYTHAESRADARRMVRQAAPVLIAGAALVALVAPAFEQLFYTGRLQYAAGLVILVIAAQLSGIRFAERFSTPAVILTGLVLSVQNPDALRFSLTYVAPALGTTTVALTALYLAAYIPHDRLSLRYVRRGGAFALTTVALSQFGVQIPSGVGVAGLAAALIIAAR